MTTCLNCSAKVESKFCPACGQSAHIHPITIRHVIHDLVHAFTHADKGFIFTLKELLIRPGTVALKYIEGKRKQYFNPLSFLVITLAVSGYLSYRSGYFDSMPRRGPATATQMQVNSAPSIMEKAQAESWKIITKDGKLIGLFLSTPLMAFLSWIFFRKPRHHYAEHFVLHAYLFGLCSVFRVVIFIPLHLLLPGKVSTIDIFFQLTFLTYIIIASRQFFRQHIALCIVKGISILVLFIILFWVVILSYASVKVLLLS